MAKGATFNGLNSCFSLVEAEQDYTIFNALRTTPSPAAEGICRAVGGSFCCVFDPTRPESPYYNRAVLLPASKTADFDFSRLPDSVRGIEIFSPQQTEEISQDLSTAGFRPGSSLRYLAAEPADGETPCRTSLARTSR